MMLPRLALPAIVLIAVVSGCGSSNDGGKDRAKQPAQPAPLPGGRQRTPSEQVKRYFAAVDRGDGATACDVLTDQAGKAFGLLMAGLDAPDCATNVEKLSRISFRWGKVRVSRVKIDGNRASALAAGRRPYLKTEVELAKKDGVWRISYPPGAVTKNPGPPGIPSEKTH